MKPLSRLVHRCRSFKKWNCCQTLESLINCISNSRYILQGNFVLFIWKWRGYFFSYKSELIALNSVTVHCKIHIGTNIELVLKMILYDSGYPNNRPLHDPVTWYGINYAGTQLTQSGWTGKSSFVLELPLRYLGPSIIYSVPCDQIVQMLWLELFLMFFFFFSFQLGWEPLMESYMNTLPKSLNAEHVETIRALFLWLVQPCLCEW